MSRKLSKFYALLLCLLLVAACGRQSSKSASDAEIEYDRGTVRSEGYTVTFEYVGTAQ